MENNDNDIKQLQQIADLMNSGYKPSQEDIEKQCREIAELDDCEGLGEIKVIFNNVYEAAKNIFPESRSFTKEEAKEYEAAIRTVFKPTGRNFNDLLLQEEINHIQEVTDRMMIEDYKRLRKDDDH